ncbi:MAG: NAD-binding protein [Desulfofustis sp. PB-SRB1]|jgi:voltage-gated potassium channel|nr:NAD-binding protein [Desulfofustis sp. PB-SRB1]MBM1002410.1 NAD-binding protein [Desulfofustis sp. PB-SRB1]HBH29627.1 potassium transporter TrkA [Desulfofustis sp.]HBH32780.1 potassium transporter TrkA [Desulfofustis sp.]
MKFLMPQLLFFFRNKTTQRNLVLLSKFLVFLGLIICIYSLLFHLLMMYEGRNFSWVTGLYWTMTVMSTLGFGDITFHSDIGRVFTMVVLISGIMFLLIILPFTFIQFFYAPWLEAQEKTRIPRAMPDNVSNHVIITHVDPITTRLIEYLIRYHQPYVIVVADPQEAGRLQDAGYRVVLGEIDLPATYRNLRVAQASLVVVTNDDQVSTNIAFTIREVDETVPIVTNAENQNSIDILEYSGNTSVFEFMKMLGESLSKRTFGVGRSANIIGRMDDLLISEMPAMYTGLEGKTLAQAQIGQQTGVNVIGMSERGRFLAATPHTVINAQTIMMLAGSTVQLKKFDQLFEPSYQASNAEPEVLILGGGRVGDAAAATLAAHDISYRVIEKRAVTADRYARETIVTGDAADINTLKEAGIEQAHSVIVTTHSDDMNIYLTFYCRKLRADIQIISRSILQRNVAKLYMAGADQVMSYASLGAGTIFQLLQPNEMTLLSEGMVVLHHLVGPAFTGKTIMNSGIREQSGFSIIAIKRNGNLLVSPPPETELHISDELIAIGTSENKDRFLHLPS